MISTRHRRAPLRLWLDEPYRLFFTLGFLWALAGVGYWLLAGHVPFMRDISSKVHVWLQVYGFMGCFVIGFLATAIPRFADARFLNPAEVGVLAVLSTTACVGVLRFQLPLAHLCFMTAMLVLAACLIPRALAAAHAWPASFVLIPFGVGAAAIGSGMQALLSLGWVPMQAAALQTLSMNLLFQGLVIFLIVGVGGFLIRSVLGWAPNGSPADPAAARRARNRELDLHFAAGVAICVSFWFEAYFSPRWGITLRALVVTLEAIGQLRIDLFPRSGKLGAHWLRLAIWLLLAGLWGDALIATSYPLYRLAFLHLCFAGGFSLVTVAIATRVILAHTGFEERLQVQYWPFAVAQALLLLGAVARFGADFSPASYGRHLFYAAASWIAGLLIWSIFVLTRVTLQRVSANRS